MAIVETENLTKYYGKSRGILEVTLSIQEGEFFGFIGPNGAGKSTTIRTLMSLLHPSSGRAEIFGLDCRTQGPRIRKQVGYLPAEANYYDDMRVKDLLRYAASFYKVDCRARIAQLCEVLELDRGTEVLLKIDRVGMDMTMGQGMCGSISGSVPTNVGQPMIRVSSLTVGGR